MNKREAEPVFSFENSEIRSTRTQPYTWKKRPHDFEKEFVCLNSLISTDAVDGFPYRFE
jgi:hypothetical protein